MAVAADARVESKCVGPNMVEMAIGLTCGGSAIRTIANRLLFNMRMGPEDVDSQLTSTSDSDMLSS